jgi:hypothetical protein
MKNLILPLLALSAPAAFAAPTIDQIEVLQCTVVSVEVRTSFDPPVPGDTVRFATWQLQLDELKFDRVGSTNKSYVTIPAALERVDWEGFRNENLRTFMGIHESATNRLRTEAVLKISGSQAGIAATYAVRHRVLPHGQFTEGDSVSLSCVAEKLWAPRP